MSDRADHDAGTPLLQTLSPERIEGREWWLWGFAVIVTLALTLAIVALVYPGLDIPSVAGWSDLKDWVRGLAALVLLFDLYTIYQHLQLSRLRRQAAERAEMFQLITENAADMIAVVDLQGRRLYNSPAYERILGYSPEELRSTRTLEQIHPEDRPRVEAAAAHARTTGRGERLEYRIRHKDGSWRILESTASAVRNSTGTIEKLVIVNRDISDRKRAEALLAHNALHDSLTQLPNRAMFLRHLESAFARSKRHQDYHFSVLLLDIDQFKLVNESLGHDAGDELLTQLGRRLTDSLRRLDTVGRPALPTGLLVDGAPQNDALAKVGGDEYAILLDDLRDPSDAVRVARRLQHAVAPAFQVGGHEIVIEVSIGIALNRPEYASPAEMVRDADIAVNRAKQRGKSQCEVFDTAMHDRAVKRLQVEADLRKGIAQGELKVFYQPINSLRTDRIVGFEALSRWQRSGGMVMPGEFIEVADETGLIIPINQQLLSEACRNLTTWRRQYAASPPLYLSINITPRHFAEPNLARSVAEILAHTGIEATGLELEIVETVAMGDAQRANEVLSELKQVGVNLAIDDFGTGFSSLSRLQHLPVDSLKIDRSFIARLEEDAAAREIVNTIILLAHAVGLRAIAEGVETECQVRLLKQLGCDLAQGFYYARPQDAAAVTRDLLGLAATETPSGQAGMPATAGCT